jgi:hypothetical protein
VKPIRKPDKVILLRDLEPGYLAEREQTRVNGEPTEWLKNLQGGIDRLKDNALVGEPIEKNKTKGYAYYQLKLQKMGFTLRLEGLWWLPRGNSWRIIYTVQSALPIVDVGRYSVYVYLLDFIDHNTYKKIFGYR